jgi:hypothetical protein
MDNRLLERIQKLLALADPTKNDSQAQVEAALEKVTKLLAENDLTMEEVKHHQPKEDIIEQFVGIFKHDGTLIGKNHNKWLFDLIDHIAYANYCKPLFSPKGGVFVGKEKDVKIASFMLDNIAYRLIAISREEMNQYMKEYRERTGLHPWRDSYGSRHPRIWRREWLEGAVSALGRKLREDRKSKELAAYLAQQEGNDQKFALITTHNQTLDSFVKETRPNIKTVNHDKMIEANGIPEAYNKGHKTGESLAIQQGLEEGYKVTGELKG